MTHSPFSAREKSKNIIYLEKYFLLAGNTISGKDYEEID
jgi:hypothetical protein